jgi:hypothetical protein
MAKKKDQSNWRRTNRTRFFAMLRAYEEANGVRAVEKHGPSPDTSDWMVGAKQVGYKTPSRGYLGEPTYWIDRVIYEKHR